MAESLDDLIGTMASLIGESELKTNSIEVLKEKSAEVIQVPHFAWEKYIKKSTTILKL